MESRNVLTKTSAALDPVSLNTAAVSPPKNASGAAVQGKMEFDDFTKLIKLLRE